MSRRILIGGLCLVALFAGRDACCAAAGSAGAAADGLSSPASLLSKDTAQDGSAVLQSMLDKVKHIGCYVYQSYLTTHEGGKVVEETGKFYFKAPNLVRFEVIKAGSRSGAVVVRQANGKIKGHLGGLLSGVKLTLSPDSKLLKSANGFNILDSDLDTLLTGARTKARSENCLEGEVSIAGTHPHIIELAQPGGVVDNRIAIDWSDKLPSDWSIFQGNKLFSTARFANLQIANDLPDALFTLEGEAEAKDMEAQEYQGNTILANLGAKPLTADSMNQVGKAISMLEKKVQHLKDEQPFHACDDGSTFRFVSGGAEQLLISATEIEWLVSDLKSIEKSLKTLEEKQADGKTTLAHDWSKGVTECTHHAAKLMDMVVENKPEQSSFDTAVDGMLEQAHGLEEIQKRCIDLL